MTVLNLQKNVLIIWLQMLYLGGHKRKMVNSFSVLASPSGPVFGQGYWILVLMILKYNSCVIRFINNHICTLNILGMTHF